MSEKATLKEALQEAIRDYNEWAIEKAKGYDSIAAYSELRGIFYNKLRGRLAGTGWSVTGWRYSRHLNPEDLQCEIEGSTCLLKNLLLRPLSDHSHPDKKKLIHSLTEARKEVSFEIGYRVQGRESLSLIIHQIKNFKYERTSTGK